MIRLNPTYDTAHPFNPWRLLGPAWDPTWTAKEPPAPAKTWMRSPEGRAAQDAFFAAYAAAEEIYLAAKKDGSPDTSRTMRRRAREGFSRTARLAAKAWREKQAAKIAKASRLATLRAYRPNREAKTAVSALMGLMSVPRLVLSTDY